MKFQDYLREKMHIELEFLVIIFLVFFYGLVIFKDYLIGSWALLILALPSLMLLVYMALLYYCFIEYKAIMNCIKAMLTNEYSYVNLKRNKSIECLGIPRGIYKAMINKKDFIILKVLDQNGKEIYGPQKIEPELFLHYFE